MKKINIQPMMSTQKEKNNMKPSRNHPWRKFKIVKSDKSLADYGAVMQERGKLIEKDKKKRNWLP
jgi:hypothetical protein